MFKKFLTAMLLVVASISLVSCGDKDKDTKRTYVTDGKYVAFKAETYNNAPQLTTVTVTIKNDKIESFYIDCTQGKLTDGAAAFNAKTKKELMYEYKMHWYTYTATLEEGATPTEEGYKAWMTANSKLEWFEQAQLIEAALLKNGVSSVTVDGDNVINNVTGVTIKDGGYLALAKEAVEMAIKGEVQCVAADTNSVTWVSAKVDKSGKLSDYLIDTLQSSVTEGTFAFDAKSKQEKGYGYHMHWYTYLGSLEEGATPTEEGYKTWLTANSKLEWFEQVANFVNEWLKGTTFETDDSGHITNVTGVTIQDSNYSTVLSGLLSLGFKK